MLTFNALSFPFQTIAAYRFCFTAMNCVHSGFIFFKGLSYHSLRYILDKGIDIKFVTSHARVDVRNLAWRNYEDIAISFKALNEPFLQTGW